MDHVLSTHLFAQHRLTTALLERIGHAGVPAVEIFCAMQHLDYNNRAQMAELGHWFRDSTLKAHALHSPIYRDDVWGRSGPDAVISITEQVKWKRQKSIDEIKRALEFAELVPFRYLIQHLGAGGEVYDDHKLDAAFTALEELKLFAGQRGVEILLENIPNQLASAERLLHFLLITHLNLMFCFDSGHANLGEGVETAFKLMQERIRSTHLHDNDGERDIHLFPLVAQGGSIDWRQLMGLLRSRADQYPLVLELKESPEFPQPLEQVKQIFEQLESIEI